MKKIVFMLLALMLMVSLAIPAMAADTEVTVTPSSNVGYLGNEVEFTVSVATSVPYTSFGYTLSYDAEVFEFVKYELAANPGAMIFMFDQTRQNLLMNFSQPTSYSGELVTITLRVKDKAALSNTEISGKVSCKNSATNTDVEVAFHAAEISIGCEHEFVYTNVDETNHEAYCAKCETRNSEAHTWGGGTTVNEPTCTEPGEEKSTCTKCSAEKLVTVDATGHAWDNDCDATCNNECGYTRETGHLYGEEWSVDADGHWYECETCGDRKDYVEHIPGPEATEQAPQNCTVCGYEIAAQLKHTHAFSADWQNDVNGHWKFCMKAGCQGRGEESAHDYDNNCDVSCDTCGYVRVAPHNYGLEWRANATGHWHDCNTCDAQTNVLPHVPGAEATQDAPQVCEDCNYWIKFPLSHVHNFGETWSSDDQNHWQICQECDEKNNLAAHTWTQEVIQQPTETEPGVIQHTCTVCAKQVTEPLAPQASQPTTPTDEPSVPSTPQGTQTSPTAPSGTAAPTKLSIWWIVAALAILLLLVGLVLLVIEIIRGFRKNRHGKFSK